MPDWTASMQQTYAYYEVDPGTWRDLRKIENVISSSIKRDSSNDTGGSASFNVSSDLGEVYIRTYLVTTQNRIVDRTCLGTHLCQTTDDDFDGKSRAITLDGYSPLLELKETSPPIGYALAANVNILEAAKRLAMENLRAPVVDGEFKSSSCWRHIRRCLTTTVRVRIDRYMVQFYLRFTRMCFLLSGY